MHGDTLKVWESESLTAVAMMDSPRGGPWSRAGLPSLCQARHKGVLSIGQGPGGPGMGDLEVVALIPAASTLLCDYGQVPCPLSLCR